MNAKWLITVSSVLVLLLLTSDIAYSETEKVYPIYAGHWDGGHYRKSDGSFSHCSVAATYNSGITVGLGITEGGDFHMAFFSDKWVLPIGELYKIKITIDQQDMGVYTAEVTTEESLGIIVRPTDPLVQNLQKGFLLKVYTANEELLFDLSDTYQAIEKVKLCANRALDRKPERNPFEEDKTLISQRKQKNDDEIFIRELLETSGLTNTVFIKPGASNKESALHTWLDGGIEGAEYDLHLEGGNIDIIFMNIQEVIEKDCEGIPSAKPDITNYSNGYQVGGLLMSCSKLSDDSFVSIVGISKGDFVMYFIHTTYDPGEADRLRGFHRGLLTGLISSITSND